MRKLSRTDIVIGLMGAVALVLLVLHVVLPGQQALAVDSTNNRDWQMVTAPTARGTDALYVIDNSRGLIAVFTWDRQQRALVPRTVQPVETFFQ